MLCYTFSIYYQGRSTPQVFGGSDLDKLLIRILNASQDPKIDELYICIAKALFNDKGAYTLIASFCDELNLDNIVICGNPR